MDALKEYVPLPSSPMNIVCALINILLWPGLGTIIAGFLEKDNPSLVMDIVIGVLQMVLTTILVGWIWAVVWGIVMILNPGE